MQDASNLDKDQKPLARDDRRRMFNLGNRLWHSDSSYRAVPAKYSLLSGRIVVDRGGRTEFADMRAAFDALNQLMQCMVEPLRAHHSIVYSREIVGFTFTEEERAQMCGAVHPLISVNPSTGRRSLYLARHASHIVGWPLEKGRQLIEELISCSTVQSFVYRHKWSPGDLVIWDNRATMHRALPFDTSLYRRQLRRLTTLDERP